MSKTKRETKELGMETRPGEGVVKEEKFPNRMKSSHTRVCGEFWNLRGQHNWEEEKKKNKNLGFQCFGEFAMAGEGLGNNCYYAGLFRRKC